MATDSKKTEVGSYFISNYPPFSQWTEEQVSELKTAMTTAPQDVPLGLYLHIPFCRKRCKFCISESTPTKMRDRSKPISRRYLVRLNWSVHFLAWASVRFDSSILEEVRLRI